MRCCLKSTGPFEPELNRDRNRRENRRQEDQGRRAANDVHATLHEKRQSFRLIPVKQIRMKAGFD